jgi:CheY-like chemotaxis protein
MPVMTGVEVARTVRAMGCAVRIVGCTGNALEEDQIEYLDAGADGVCPKPVRQADIQAQLALVR